MVGRGLGLGESGGGLPFGDAGVHDEVFGFEGAVEGESGIGADAGEADVGLAVGEGAAFEVHVGGVKGLALGFVDGGSPAEADGELGEGSDDFFAEAAGGAIPTVADFFPGGGFDDDVFVAEADEDVVGAELDDLADLAVEGDVGVSGDHDLGADFELEVLVSGEGGVELSGEGGAVGVGDAGELG